MPKMILKLLQYMYYASFSPTEVLIIRNTVPNIYSILLSVLPRSIYNYIHRVLLALAKLTSFFFSNTVYVIRL